MTARAIAVALILAACCACGGESRNERSSLSATKDLALVQATYGPNRYSRLGAPIDALTVTGTIANRGRSPLLCNADAFIVTDSNGESFIPVATSCEVPQIAPGSAASFSATFRTPLKRRMQLHFEHNDGTYELRDLRVHT